MYLENEQTIRGSMLNLKSYSIDLGMQIRKNHMAVGLVLVVGVFIGSFPRPYGLISFAKQSIFPDTMKAAI
jgi:hypothetical protein